MTSNSLRIIPLGGLGEIGMNCMLLETEDTIAMIDCGVLFPERSDIGIDVLHPDFSYLRKNRDRFRGVVLTHGHEDHIGALPFLLREFDVPVYGPRYALRLVASRLREHELKADLNMISPGDVIELGDLSFEPVHVTHSTVDCTALLMRTPAGTVIHSGDFHIDRDPIDGLLYDEARMRRAGDEGVRLLMSDSTNVDVEEMHTFEREVHQALADVVENAPLRVVVAMFASNVHRLSSLLDIAKQTGRQITFLGRSVETHARTAAELSFLKNYGAQVVSPRDLASVPRERSLVVASGTQAETNSALAKLSRDEHTLLTLGAGDTVVFSSRIIPGNERPVFALTNEFERRGIEIRTVRTDKHIHASGHAARNDQRALIEMTRPQAFIPIHGTYHHLRRHESLAIDEGIRESLVMENGDIIQLTDRDLYLVESFDVPRIHIGPDAREVPPLVIEDRSLLAELGFAMATVVLDDDGLAAPISITTRGVIEENANEALLERARGYLSTRLESMLDEPDAAIQDEIRRSLRRFFTKELGVRPLTYASVIHV